MNPALAGETNVTLPRVPPTEPAAATATFRVQDGFRMELIAAEPLVTDPVAMAYDENGRAYVVEMNDYPYTDKQSHQAWKDNVTDAPIGRVRLLEDTDGDGRFDRSEIFATGLSWPTGIAMWKGGVFVTATPDIWYLKDTDGDGRADVRRKVFTGFRKYNVQAVINNLTWGLDNRIYGAGSSNGGEIASPGKPDEKPIRIARQDFRIDPVTETFEPISGSGRFGNAFDDWGNRFICNIRNPIQHVVLPNEYLARNPLLPVGSALHDVAAAGDTLPVFRISPVEPWRELRAQVWSKDSTMKVPRSELVGGGVFTSTSGIIIYRGAAYPESYRGQVLVGEVANNIIHRQTLAPDGVTFTAQRSDANAEFVASTDIWFRPVNFVNAPDGTLHVLDMYREVIEHPWSIPDDIHAQLDLESGRDRGRIYRLAPTNFKPFRPPRLGKASVRELVATLENPNAWWRETAQRLLFERQDRAAVAPLRKLVTRSKSPLARLHALWALEGLGALTEKEILRGLNDPVAGVRENSVRLAETRLAESPAIIDRVIALADDPDPRVRFQVAFTLGNTSDPRATAALAGLLRRDGNDSWMRTAVLSAPSANSAPLLTELLQRGNEPAGAESIRLLARMTGARKSRTDVQRVLAAAFDSTGHDVYTSRALLTGLGDGLKGAGSSLSAMAADSPENLRASIRSTFDAARRDAVNPTQPARARLNAIELLSNDEWELARETLVSLLDAQHPQEVQRAAVRALSSFTRVQVADALLGGWPKSTPAVRNELIEALLARKERLTPLLRAIDDRLIPANQINATRRALLMNHGDATIRSRAKEVFGEGNHGSRASVVEQYRAVLTMRGDKARGEKVFETHCMNCHRAGETGFDVGPGLATVRQWTPEQIVLNILDPNREVSPSYVDYAIELRNGETISGIIAAETASGLTLRRAGGAEETVLRQDIERMSSSGLSLMPEGLELGISIEAMADLLAFIQAHQ